MGRDIKTLTKAVVIGIAMYRNTFGTGIPIEDFAEIIEAKDENEAKQIMEEVKKEILNNMDGRVEIWLNSNNEYDFKEVDETPLHKMN